MAECSIVVEGLQSSSVRCAANAFKDFCIMKGLDVCGPMARVEGRQIFTLREAVPSVSKNNVRVHISQLSVKGPEENIKHIACFTFGTTVNVSIVIHG